MPQGVPLREKILQHLAPDGLPAQECLRPLAERLQSPSACCALKAPTGSGKTIYLPCALWETMGLPQVWILEPRRVTARLPAMALRQLLGDVVGYRIRLESQWHKSETRVGYLTYGTALRLFSHSPPRPDELVIFDEYHERSWEAELLLALLSSRPNPPKLLLMSATLDLDSLPRNTEIVESAGRLHPVEISWEGSAPQLHSSRDALPELIVTRSVELKSKSSLEQLIFLPGMAEIRRVAEFLRSDPLSGPVDILHSSLKESEIRRVVDRSPREGFRRILATNMAESSVTLPGVGVVIDSGLYREAQSDELELGIRLRTAYCPRSSLAQRAGRAGRLGPGLCHRLFTKEQEYHRNEFVTPGILTADSRQLALHLSRYESLKNWDELSWVATPPSTKIEAAIDWLRHQSLLNEGLELTDRARSLLSFPLDLRIANFCLLARESALEPSLIVEIATALENPSCRAARSIESLLAENRRRTPPTWARSVSKQLAAIKPLCQRELSEVFLLSHGDSVSHLRGDRAIPKPPGTEALLFEPEEVQKPGYGVLLSLSPRTGKGPKQAVQVYKRITADALWESQLDQMEECVDLNFQSGQRSVLRKRELRLGQLILETQQECPEPGPAVGQILWDNLNSEAFGEAFSTLVRRVELFLEFGAQDESALVLLPPGQSLAHRLAKPYLETVTAWSKGSSSELLSHAKALLGFEFCRELDRQLPESLDLPGRRKPVTVHYPPEREPYVRSKLQDFFGWKQYRLMGGAVELVYHLLAPNGRECQVTKDLESFWKGSYSQVRKDLRGRYPKHDWPEEPSSQR